GAAAFRSVCWDRSRRDGRALDLSVRLLLWHAQRADVAADYRRVAGTIRGCSRDPAICRQGRQKGHGASLFDGLGSREFDLAATALFGMASGARQQWPVVPAD